MFFDPEKIRANAAKATTEDLLDRVTVYRAGMEAEALDILERELRERGINRETIDVHEERRRAEVLFDSEGIAQKCSHCRRPAVAAGWGWHRLWGLLPVFPRWVAWCAEHQPKK